MRRAVLFLLAMTIAPFMPASITQARTSFHLKSADFANGRPIPVIHEADTFGCNGQNVPPVLSWKGVPARTRSFVLTMIDSDAPGGGFVHWIVYNIPATRHTLGPGSLSGVQQGRDDAGRSSYVGPCPPNGTDVHHYHFTLYALSIKRISGSDLNLVALEQAMRHHVLGQASLVGTFERT